MDFTANFNNLKHGPPSNHIFIAADFAQTLKHFVLSTTLFYHTKSISNFSFSKLFNLAKNTIKGNQSIGQAKLTVF